MPKKKYPPIVDSRAKTSREGARYGSLIDGGFPRELSFKRLVNRSRLDVYE